MAGHSESQGAVRWKTNLVCKVLLVLGLALVLAGPSLSRAALQFDVFLGYDRIVPQASWFPIVCEIKNDGVGFTGTVEVEGGRGSQQQVRRAVVELPTGTLKRFVIPVFSGTGGYAQWDVRLLDERGKVRAEQTALQPRRTTTTGTPLMGALVRSPAGLPVFAPLLSKENNLQPQAARLMPDIFPDNPVVLEGIDCLYLNTEVALKLQVGQVNALLAWLHGGGHLIVGVEQISDIAATPWLRSVLPYDLTDFRAVQGHSELLDWLRSGNWPAGTYSSGSAPAATQLPKQSPRGEVTASSPFSDLPVDPAFELASLQVATGQNRDGQKVVLVGEMPLISTASRGCGRLTLLHFSPEREPFLSWKNLPVFWARLAEVPGELYVSAQNRNVSGWSSDAIFGAMIDSRQVHKLPVTWLLLLLLVYLVVIGPLDHYWLKRIGRPMLTWITFPCYVLLFSVLIYVIGYKLRAGESEWNELHLVDVLPKGDQVELRGRTYASVYSPSNQRYRLDGRQEYAALRNEFAGFYNPGQSSDRATFTQEGDASFKADIFVPVWSSVLLVSDWWEPASMPLAVSVVRQGSGWEVKVDNQTDRRLTASHLVVQDLILPLGEVPAHEARTVKVTPDQGQSLSSYVSSHAASFREAVSSRQHMFGGGGSGHLNDLPNGTMAASFLSRQKDPRDNTRQFILPPGLDLSSVAAGGKAVLLAYADDYAPVKPMRQFNPKRNHRSTLWRVPVSIQ